MKKAVIFIHPYRWLFNIAISSIFMANLLWPYSDMQDSLKPGTPAPPIQITQWLQAPEGFDGQRVYLEGKVVVLEFWATWCSLCVAAIPHLNQLATEFRGQDVVFIAITDDYEDRLKSFLAKQPMEEIIGIDTDRKNWKTFGVVSIPHTVVIGKDGNVVGSTFPENITEATLREVLAGGKPALPPKEGVPSDLEWDQHLIEWKDGIPAAAYAIFKPVKTYTSGAWIGPARYVGDGVSLNVMIQAAYETDYYHLDWRLPRDSQNYRVAVGVPSDRRTNFLPFLRQTLNNVFGIRARWENQEHDVYALKRIKGRPTLAGSKSKEPTYMMMKGKITLRQQPIKKLCSLLTTIFESIVVDETGLGGFYDFELTYQPGQPQETMNALRPLGLELEKGKRTIQILVVEPESKAN